MFKKIGVSMLLFSLVIMQLWFINLTIQYPYLGINLKQDDQQRWFIERIDIESDASQLDFQVGDEIITVDGQPSHENFMIKTWGTFLEQVKEIGVKRNGELIHITIVGVSNSVLLGSILFISEVICFIISVLLFYKVRDSSSARILALLFFIGGLTFMSWPASIRGDILANFIIKGTVMLIPIVSLHFLFVFFKEKCDVKLPFPVVKILYYIVIFFIALSVTYAYPPFNPYLAKFRVEISLSFFAIGILINISVLSYLYYKFRKANHVTSVIIRSLWVALFLSFAPIIFLSVIPLLLNGFELVGTNYTSWFIFIFPLTFAYLLISRRLYDIHTIMRRIVFNLLVSLAPSAVVIGVIGFIFQNSATLEHLVLGFIVTISVMTFTLYYFEYFTTRLEVFLFPRKYYLRKTLKKISANLESVESFREMKELVLADIVNALDVYGSALVIRYQDSVEVISEGDVNEEEVKQLVGGGALRHPSYDCFEIICHEEYTSYLVMTKKRTNTMLTQEEKQWLQLIVSYLGVSKENLLLIRKLTARAEEFAAHVPDSGYEGDFAWFRKMMFELQEKERTRIATDLHDSTMQDIFFLKKKMQTLFDRLALNGAEAAELLGLIDYIEVINANLRQHCFELHPYLIQEIGLVRTIEQLVGQEGELAPFTIRFDSRGAEIVEELDLDTKRHVFRIVQELVNNAKKHSEASELSIRLCYVDGMFYLNYVDDGVGYDVNHAGEKKIGGSGIGMLQMRSRINYLNARMALDTAVGKGVRIEISFPLPEGLSA